MFERMAWGSETTETWARHMCAEYTDEKGLWQCPENKANHGWDCSVYNLVAADILGVRFWRNPNSPGPAPRAKVTVRSKFMRK